MLRLNVSEKGKNNNFRVVAMTTMVDEDEGSGERGEGGGGGVEGASGAEGRRAAVDASKKDKLRVEEMMR